MAIMIISIGLMMEASAAVCPSTSAPMMPMDVPICPGMRRFASLIIKNDNSISSISKYTGSGTLARVSAMVVNSDTGIRNV